MDNIKHQKAGYWRSAGKMALFLGSFGLAAMGVVSAGFPIYHFLKPVKEEIANPAVNLISASLAEYRQSLRLQ